MTMFAPSFPLLSFFLKMTVYFIFNTASSFLENYLESYFYLWSILQVKIIYK